MNSITEWKRSWQVNNKTDIRLKGMLGFAMRAGKVIIGTELVCSAMASRGKDRARLLLIASDASDGTKKKLLHKAEFYGVEVLITNIDSSELGRLLGKLYAPASVAIIDDRFAEEIAKTCRTDNSETES